MPNVLRKGSVFAALLLGISLLLYPAKCLQAAEVPETEEQVPIEVSGDQLEYIRPENKIVATGNVLINYKTVKMTCDKAEVYTDSKKAYAEGHVYIYFESGQVLRGDKVYYDFKNRQGSFPNGKVVTDKWFGKGEQIEQVSKDEIRIFNASVTTCPYDRPHYDVKAKRVTIYPKDKIVARDVVFRVLGRPIFWWPYFVIPLDTDEPPLQIQPGYSDEDGFYILTSKTTSLNKNVKVKGNVDYRSKKGIGGGVDVKYAFEKLGSGVVNTYLARDEDAPDDKISTFAGNPFSDRVVENRGRVSVKHRMDIDKYTNVVTEWNFFSDEFFLQEYFEREFQREINPRSFMAFTKNTERYGFLVNVEKRTNRFFNTLERLPQVRFDLNRREIMNSNFYYRAENEFVNYNKKFANSSFDEDVVRFDTFHELSYPIKIFSWDVIPFGNVRETFYSKNKFGEEYVSRNILGNGVDVSTRFYKVYDFSTNLLGLDVNKIRHVFEPSMRYNANRNVSVSPNSLQIFDGIDEQFLKDEFTFGFENRIQTKRFSNGTWHRVDLISFNTFLTYSYDDFFVGNSQWTKWRQEIQARPYDWFIGQTIWNFDMVSGQFVDADVDVILEKQPIRILIGHRFEKQNEGFGGKSLFQFDVNYQVTPLWALGGYMRTEFDTNTVEEWEVRATRDLHDWYLDFGYNVRNSEIDSADKELFFELRLKAFPQFPLKGGNRATFSRPRIGHFVSGANRSPNLVDNTSTTPQYSS